MIRISSYLNFFAFADVVYSSWAKFHCSGCSGYLKQEKRFHLEIDACLIPKKCIHGECVVALIKDKIYYNRNCFSYKR